MPLQDEPLPTEQAKMGFKLLPKRLIFMCIGVENSDCWVLILLWHHIIQLPLPPLSSRFFVTGISIAQASKRKTGTDIDSSLFPLILKMQLNCFIVYVVDRLVGMKSR